MTITPKTLWLGMALMLAGCTSPDPPAPKDREPGEYRGRADTKSLRNADAVGYDGAAIQKKLDAALDKNEQRAAGLDQQIEAQSGGAETPEQQ
jgi:hypothetical protein